MTVPTGQVIRQQCWEVEHHTYLHILSVEVGDLWGESARGIHWTYDGISLLEDAIPKAHAEVVLSKPRGLVDYSGTALSGDVCITGNKTA